MNVLPLSTYKKPELLQMEHPFRIDIEQYSQCGLVVEPHWHEHVELLYFFEGKVEVDGNGIRGKGDIAIFNSYDLHRVEILEAPARYLCIILDPSMLVMRNLAFGPGVCSSAIPSFLTNNESRQDRVTSTDLRQMAFFSPHPMVSPHVAAYFIRMCLSFERADLVGEYTLLSDLYGALANLLESGAGTLLPADDHYKRIRAARTFEPLLKELESRIAEKWDVERAASFSGLSAFHFCRRFHAAVGFSFASYLRDLRLRRARRFLKETDLPISEVAVAVGFQDPNHFCRLFRQTYGISPGKARSSELFTD